MAGVTAYDGERPSPQFRAAMSRLASGVVALTTRSGNHDYAMTATAIASVSLEPPLLLVCVESSARFHEAVVDSGAFVVSLLSREQRRAAEWLATPGKPLIGQFDQIPHTRSEAGIVLLTGSLATLECRVHAVHGAGDHSIVVGEVVQTALAERPGDALVHYRSRYGSLS